MWFSRRSWPLFLSIAVGMLLANMLVCLVPLATRVSITRSLQHALGEPYQNTIVVTASLSQSQAIGSATHQLDAVARQSLAYVGVMNADVALRSWNVSVNAQTLIHLKALPASYLAKNFKLVTGRFPNTRSSANEIMLTEQTAQQLSVTPGMSVTIKLASARPQLKIIQIPLLVVGIVELLTTDLRNPYVTEPIDPVLDNNTSIDTALTTAPVFLHIVQAMTLVASAPQATIQAMWVYQVRSCAVDATNFEQIQEYIQAFYQRLPAILANYSGTLSIYGNALPLLVAYDNRISATQLPLTSVAIQVVIILLWFIIALVGLLIDREKQTISILRSRGATVWQLLPIILFPLLFAALLGGFIGPWITSLLVVSLVVWMGIDPGNSSVHIGSPWSVFIDLKWYSIATTLATLVICTIGAYYALTFTIVATRRRSSRSEQETFWRRYPLDLIVCLALICVYLSYLLFIAPAVGPALYAQLAPLALYLPIFALITSTIVLFRLLPLLFTWGVRLSAKWRGVVPILAAVQLARSSNKTRQALVFLALAVSLLCFTSSYQATRIQHNQDYAAFQVGSDFSFALPIDVSHALSVRQEENRFLQIPGVQAASAGAEIDIFPQAYSSAHDRIMAVDADTYASVAAWTDTSAQPSIGMFLQQMTQMRETAERRLVVPALLDDAMMQQYQLTAGDIFTLSLDGGSSLRIQFQALGRVSHIPMVPDIAGDPSQGFLGGMMVDFSTLARIIPLVNAQVKAPPGYMWLRTAHDPASIAHIRKALAGTPYDIVAPQDRFQLLDDMAYDPLSVALEVVTLVGAAITLFLALIIGAQIIWNALAQRTLSLSVLYATGASLWQIMLVSALENIVQILLAELFGILLGAFLALATVPILAFAQSADTLQPVATLLIPLPKVFIPWGGILKGTSLSLVVCSMAIMVAVRAGVSKRLYNTLRLNED